MSAPTPSPAAEVRGTVTPGTFLVQAGTFSNRANADRLARELGAKGLAAHVAVMQGAATPWFRVRVGPAGDRGTALALLARVRTVVAGASLVSVSAPGAAAP
jgi:cell division septation protein DedD